MRKRLIEFLTLIQTLRKQHTQAFMAQDKAGMDSTNDKIIVAWNHYHANEITTREAGLCFTCNNQAVESFAAGKLLFCSAECSKQFGIQLVLIVLRERQNGPQPRKMTEL